MVYTNFQPCRLGSRASILWMPPITQFKIGKINMRVTWGFLEVTLGLCQKGDFLLLENTGSRVWCLKSKSDGFSGVLCYSVTGQILETFCLIMNEELEIVTLARDVFCIDHTKAYIVHLILKIVYVKWWEKVMTFLHLAFVSLDMFQWLRVYSLWELE